MSLAARGLVAGVVAVGIEDGIMGKIWEQGKGSVGCVGVVGWV